MNLLLDDMAERRRLVTLIAKCNTVKRFTIGENDESEALVYAWSFLERACHEFLQESLPSICSENLSLDELEVAEQRIRFNLETIFSLIQVPKSYKSFIYPIEDAKFK